MAEQYAEKVPVGAVKCNACNSFTGVEVTYDNAVVTWLVSGHDENQEVLYMPSKIVGNWSAKDVPKSARCWLSHCLAPIPTWQLKLSKYITK